MALWQLTPGQVFPSNGLPAPLKRHCDNLTVGNQPHHPLHLYRTVLNPKMGETCRFGKEKETLTHTVCKYV